MQLLFALTGTTVLGFLCAVFLLRRRFHELKQEAAKWKKRHSDLLQENESLRQELEVHNLTVENLHHLLLEFEQKNFELRRSTQQRASNVCTGAGSIPMTKRSVPFPDQPPRASDDDPILHVVEHTRSAQAATLIRAFKQGVERESDGGTA